MCLRCTSGSPQSQAQGGWSPSSRPLGLSSRCRPCPVHGPRAELRSHTGLTDVPALVSLVQVAEAVVPSGRALRPLQLSLWLLPHSLPASHQGPGPSGCVSTAPPPIGEEAEGLAAGLRPRVDARGSWALNDTCPRIHGTRAGRLDIRGPQAGTPGCPGPLAW